MKTTFVLIISLLGFYLTGRTQTSADSMLSTKKSASTYFIIESKNTKPLTTRDLLVGINEADERIILSYDSVHQYYSNIKADYILTVRLKPGVKLVNLQQLFNKYQIDKQYRSFQVLCDGIEAEDAKTLLASEDYIKGLKVDTDKRQIYIFSKDYEKFLEFRRQAAEDKAKRLKLYENSK